MDVHVSVYRILYRCAMPDSPSSSVTVCICICSFVGVCVCVCVLQISASMDRCEVMHRASRIIHAIRIWYRSKCGSSHTIFGCRASPSLRCETSFRVRSSPMTICTARQAPLLVEMRSRPKLCVAVALPIAVAFFGDDMDSLHRCFRSHTCTFVTTHMSKNSFHIFQLMASSRLSQSILTFNVASVLP